MSFKNTIPFQDKSQGDSISFREWNNAVNQLKIQGNHHANILTELSKIASFSWSEFKEDEVMDVLQTIRVPDGDIPYETLEDVIEFVNNTQNNYAPEDYRFNVLEYEDFRLYSQPVFNKIEQDIMIGRVNVYTESKPFSGFRTIDDYTLQTNDTILVVGNGKENGIYRVNENGVWQHIQKVETFQVVSIDSGTIYGGSMQKKMDDGTTLQVKNPERSAWRVFI